MKRTFIGGTLTSIGAICTIVIWIYISSHLVGSYNTPPGRFVTTLDSMEMRIPFFFAIVLFVVGFVILGIEYFKD